MPVSLTHLRLCVSDLPANYRFYHEILGLPLVAPLSIDEVYTEIVTPTVIIALFSKALMAETVGAAALPANAPAQDSAVIVFMVENVDEKVAELATKGIQPIVGPTDRPVWALRTAHYRDPEGNLVEVCCDLPAAHA